MSEYDSYIGRVFDGRYTIEKKIGVGGMAVVYEAYDSVMKRPVALKLLKDEFAEEDQSVKRFINESRAVSMLSHPNIVNIFDVSVDDDEKYIVMEMVDGISLKSYMKQKGKLSVDEVLYYTEQILSGLDHAHSKGIIHRDIKPQNIMLLRNGQIKVADFGIAKLPDAKTLTATDKAIGTVYYVSPEQAGGKEIDRRSDIYSLGVVMYEMLTGKLPFDGDSPLSVALKQVNETPVPPTEINPDIPEGLEKVVLTAMEKKKDDRFQNASEMLREIVLLRKDINHIPKSRNKKKKSDNNKKSAARLEKDRRSNRAMLPIVLGVIFGVIIVAIVTVSLLVSSGVTGNKIKTIEVEDFVGRKYDQELISEMESKSYRIDVKLEYSDDSEEGTIISQDPEYGEQRKVIEGSQPCDITLVVSGGEEAVTLPDFTAMDYRTAQTKLNELGLSTKIDKVSCDYLGKNLIISTDPKPGEKVKVGTSVTLTVSN